MMIEAPKFLINLLAKISNKSHDIFINLRMSSRAAYFLKTGLAMKYENACKLKGMINQINRSSIFN